MMKKVISSPTFWTGVVGAILAVGGFAWYYQQYQLLRAKYDSLMNAGWTVEMHLPVFPRVLALIGLFGVLLAVASAASALRENMRERRKSRSL